MKCRPMNNYNGVPLASRVIEIDEVLEATIASGFSSEGGSRHGTGPIRRISAAVFHSHGHFREVAASPSKDGTNSNYSPHVLLGLINSVVCGVSKSELAHGLLDRD